MTLQPVPLPAWQAGPEWPTDTWASADIGANVAAAPASESNATDCRMDARLVRI
jgi:hypothetical protein